MIPNIIVSAILITAAALALGKISSDRKKGKLGCDGTCSTCPQSDFCHEKPKEEGKAGEQTENRSGDKSEE